MNTHKIGDTLHHAQVLSPLRMEDQGRTVTRNANFKNPLGLVYRMLSSGNSAARSALAHEALRHIMQPLDMLLSRKETRVIDSSIASETLPLILIVGPPRAGTTMVYQVLANSLDVTFLNNFAAMFSRSPILARQLFDRCSKANTFEVESYFGQTPRLAGPNDGFSIWNRWLGSDRYKTTTDLSESKVRQMGDFFRTWTSTFGKPFLNKNNRNTQCMALLAEHLPTAYFIVVNRDPMEIARSLIRARETVQGDKATGWGLQSQEMHASKSSLGYVDDVCEQIMAINTNIGQQLSRMDRSRVIEFDYHEFCTSPQSHMNQVLELVPQLDRSAFGLTYDPTLTPSLSATLSSAEEARIRELLLSPVRAAATVQ